MRWVKFKTGGDWQNKGYDTGYQYTAGRGSMVIMGKGKKKKEWTIHLINPDSNVDFTDIAKLPLAKEPIESGVLPYPFRTLKKAKWIAQEIDFDTFPHLIEELTDEIEMKKKEEDNRLGIVNHSRMVL